MFGFNQFAAIAAALGIPPELPSRQVFRRSGIRSKSAPFKGNVTIGPQSGLRKLMRASRRGMIPPERQFIIDEAMKSARQRRRVYMSASARQMDSLATLLAARA